MGQAGYPDPAFETLCLKFLGRDTVGAHFAPRTVIQHTVLLFATAWQLTAFSYDDRISGNFASMRCKCGLSLALVYSLFFI